MSVDFSNDIDSIENFKEFKPILQQQILDKELKFMEEVRLQHESFKELDSNLSFLIECVESLKKRVTGLSDELKETFTGFQELHSQAKKINSEVELGKHTHSLICSLLTKCIPPPELIQRLFTVNPVDENYSGDLIAYHNILAEFEDIKLTYKDSNIVLICSEYHKHATNYICQRIYDVVSLKLNQLSQSNPIILQHLLATNYSIHFRFLMKYNEDVCVQLRDSHMEIMRILYMQYFQSYTDDLMKLRSTKALSKAFEFIEYVPKEKIFKPIIDKEKDIFEALEGIRNRIDKDKKYELETIVDSLYRILFDTVASHVDCYYRLYKKLDCGNEQLNNEINQVVQHVFGSVFQYFMDQIVNKSILQQNLDSFSYFIYLRQFVNCQEFCEKNYDILNNISPLREHLNGVTQLIINKVNFLMNNTILYVQSCSNTPKKDRSKIFPLTRKYSQYNSLLHYAKVIHYYQDLEELGWKFRTSIESYIVKIATIENKNVDIPTIFSVFLNIVYVTCFLKRQDEIYQKIQKDVHSLTIKEKQQMNGDIFNFQHNLEVKRETLSNLLIEKYFFFLLETLNTIKSYEFKAEHREPSEEETNLLIDHLKGFVSTFKEKWQSKLHDLMKYTEEIAEINEKSTEFWDDVEKEIHSSLQQFVLKSFLNLCEEFDKKLKGELIPSPTKLELLRGFVTFASIYAEVTKYMEIIKKRQQLSK
ncbi:Vps52 sac2 family protein [Entamoeba marina]